MGIGTLFRRLALRSREGWGPALVAAVVCVGVAALVRLIGSPWLGGATGLMLFIPSVIVATLWAGWRAAALSILMSLLVPAVVWLVTGSPLPTQLVILSSGQFVFAGVTVAAVAVALRGVLRDLEAALAAQQARQDALIESERRFRLLAEAAPVMLWVGDAEGRCTYLNGPLRKFWGAPEDLAGFDWRETLHPEDAAAVMATATAAAADGAPFCVEARYRRADGAWRVMTTDARPRFDGQGRFQGMIGVNIDVTDAREAEAALRESEQRFRAMADSAPSPVWVSGPDGAVEFGNRAMVDFFGGEESQLLGSGWTSRVHPDDLPMIEEVRQTSRARQSPFSFDARFRNAAGHWRWLRIATSPRFDGSGRFMGYVGIAFDITEAREAETALRAEEQRHAFLLRLGDTIRDLEDPVAIMAEATRMLGEQLKVPRVGYGEVDETETRVGMRAIWTDGTIDAAAGDYAMDDFGPQLSRDLKARRTVRVADVEVDPRTAGAAPAFTAMGTRAFLRVPISRGGRLQAFLFLHSPVVREWTDAEADLAEDVAERTWAAVERARAELELRESEARFRAIADTAPVLIWVTRADRKRAFVNQAYVEFWGGSYEDARDGDWRDRLHPDDVERVVRESMEGEASLQPFMLEGRYRRADGEYRWLRSYSRPRLDIRGGVLGFVGVAYDVTEAHQVEADLKRLNELLEERVTEALAEKAKAEAALMHAQRMEAVGRLTGGVAHDFNNLLTVIIGALDMVLRSPDDAARRQRLAEAALAAARRGERLTHQLLAFSRRQALRPQLCDPNALITEGEPLLRRAVGETRKLKLSLQPGLPAVNIDPSHFEAALLNLLVNAHDATPEGGSIEIATERCLIEEGELEGLAGGEYVCVRVADTGVGMTPEVAEKVFEPFFTTKAVGKGTGLGLSQVYGFVRQSGGAVTLESAVGHGTTISLYLPASTGRAEQTARPNRDDRVGGAFEGLKVLLVEDDPAVAEVAEAMLTQLGGQVTRADGPEEALARLKRRRFDLLLTDVVMPGGVNGVELARQAAALRPEMKVLLASGYAGEAVDHALADAPWPFLRKPYDAESLMEGLKKALAKATPEPAS